MKAGTVVTFYSYKGGVGRTLTLANAAALLAQWGYRVLCIDWDLEAPGLHLYFSHRHDASGHIGLTELIQAHAEGKSPRWEDHVVEFTLPDARAPLTLMTAGAQDESYVRRVQALEWPALYERHGLGAFLEAMRSEWKARFDFIFIDSRTGITDIGGICTVQLPDQLVVLFTANQQSLHGALDVARRAAEQRNGLPYDRPRLLVLPIATRFETRVEYTIAQEWLQKIAGELDPLFAEWAPAEVTAHQLLNFTRTPYVAYWSFGEKLPVIEEGTKDPESLGFALETVTALLAQGLSGTDVLVQSRDAYVEAARHGAPRSALEAAPVSPKRPVRLYLSYAHADGVYAQVLKKHLTTMRRAGLVEVWSDREIGPGEGWTERVSAEMERADVIVLLVSADFLSSDYVWEGEMRRAVQRAETGAAVLIPVIVRECDWADAPFARYSVLPRQGRSVMSQQSADVAWAEVAASIRDAAERLRAVRER